MCPITIEEARLLLLLCSIKMRERLNMLLVFISICVCQISCKQDPHLDNLQWPRMSRSRLGLYVFCRRYLFEQWYELQPTFQLLLQRPDHLELNFGEVSTYTERQVEDTGHLQSGYLYNLIKKKSFSQGNSSISSSHYTRCWKVLIPLSPFWGLLLLILWSIITLCYQVDFGGWSFPCKIELSDFRLLDFQFHSRAASLRNQIGLGKCGIQKWATLPCNDRLV